MNTASPSYQVTYHCGKCGQDFAVTQYDPTPDDEITLCFACIEKMFR